ncbi:sensor histidine kinase [Nonomuraea endophytica]|uniref:histidine kinase n=1 Tax=Nonomuraea endophytica TaxID=714136 RepID=A0A7W8A810_9ACTN|nr:histidine kinase [Nonomuraea endophytica]MBB5081255.1 signal transduction histidine kinase [Nonomuraea endophytica]
MRKNLARRWACLVLGGALLMPYMMAGVLMSGVLSGGSRVPDLMLPVELGVFAAVMPVVALTGLFLPVRALEVNAAQGLLGVHVDTPPRQARRSWQERRRTAAWFTLHLGVGGIMSGCTLAIVPFTVWTLALPWHGATWLGYSIGPGWAALPWTLAGVALLVVLVFAVAGAGALLARLAPVLLGPTPEERLAAVEEQARGLAERNRLARELHDSVGHALSVVTLQAAAAGRVLDRDPDTARAALAAIEQSARSALDDLDHVLGVLREDRAGSGGRGGTEPQATLADLDALVRASGAEVRAEVGDLSGVPAVVSREAYRIVQEALTNAIKHGHGPVRLAAAVQGDDLKLEVSNPAAARRGRGGGRGVTGMRERVRLLRGELEAGPAEGGWQVSVRLPLRSSP